MKWLIIFSSYKLQNHVILVAAYFKNIYILGMLCKNTLFAKKSKLQIKSSKISSVRRISFRFTVTLIGMKCLLINGRMNINMMKCFWESSTQILLSKHHEAWSKMPLVSVWRWLEAHFPARICLSGVFLRAREWRKARIVGT